MLKNYSAPNLKKNFHLQVFKLQNKKCQPDQLLMKQIPLVACLNLTYSQREETKLFLYVVYHHSSRFD